MQCIWSTTAKTALQYTFRCSPQSTWRTFRLTSVLASHSTRALPGRRVSYSTAAVMQQKPDLPPASSAYEEPSEDSPTTPLFTSADSDSTPMTKAQLSRAAAKAVRLCTPPDALYVVNSLHYSTFGHLKKEALRLLELEEGSHTSSLFAKPVQFKPLDFGQPVSPRLSSHCFLHALLRAGNVYHAGKYAQLMMAQGIHIRPFTLEQIVTALTRTEDSLLASVRAFKRPRNIYSSHALGLSERHFSHTGNMLAYRMLTHARKFGQRRTQYMYEVLIKACILQGEIIAGSLLFVLLVKDWRAQQVFKEQGKPEDSADQFALDLYDRPDDGTPRGVRRRHYLPHPGVELPYPKVTLLKAVTDAAEQMFAKDPGHARRDEYLQEALQALANLASYVAQGDYPFQNLAPLIRALYLCPKVERKIWATIDGKATRTKAYPHFHGFLRIMLSSFSTSDRIRLPPMDTRSCNALLHYALRHRLSPKLACDVLNHMAERELPLRIETLNILLRSGTILRREDMADKALLYVESLRSLDPSAKSALVTPVSKVITRGIHPERVFSHTPFAKALDRIRTQPLALPENLYSRQNPTPLRADAYTVVSYINHLTSTGMPHIVANKLFDILPELKAVDHPAWGGLPADRRDLAPSMSREDCLRSGAKLGPYFFSALLHALVKSGHTGLAERVWIFAREAERASWDPELTPDTKPWCLSVHAYTAMLQSYANESRKGISRREFRKDGVETWFPKPNSYVRGWAYFMHEYRLRIRKHGARMRHDAARELATLLVRSVASGGVDVIRSLHHTDQVVAAGECPPGLSPPKPDARFFNAALYLFKPVGQTLPHRSRLSRASGRRFLRRGHSLYYETGQKSQHWNAHIEEIARLMLQNGYPIPPGFRHLFIGRFAPATEHFEPPRTLLRSPYHYPPPKPRYSAYSLPTHKERGLPIRRVAPIIGVRRRRRRTKDRS